MTPRLHHFALSLFAVALQAHADQLPIRAFAQASLDARSEAGSDGIAPESLLCADPFNIENDGRTGEGGFGTPGRGPGRPVAPFEPSRMGGPGMGGPGMGGPGSLPGDGPGVAYGSYFDAPDHIGTHRVPPFVINLSLRPDRDLSRPPTGIHGPDYGLGGHVAVIVPLPTAVWAAGVPLVVLLGAGCVRDRRHRVPNR